MFNSNPAKYLAGWAFRNAKAAYRETQEKTMTNAIEQSKREMYAKFSDLYTHVLPSLKSYELCKIFESALESYLELLRQDHEALHETARKRFEDIQGLEAVNRSLSDSMDKRGGYIIRLIDQLERMTEERDILRNRQQASDHAQSDTPANTVAGNNCKVVAEGLQDDGDMVFRCDPNKPRKCDNDSCEARKIAIGTMQKDKDDRASSEQLGASLNILLQAIDLCNRTSNPATGYAAWLLNNDKCMHSFTSGEQCVFCGVGK